MQLHEAVQAARKELKLSQKRLAEMSGIQRRQLATLEAGGNVTLATLRKVLAQLPNLESFTLDVVTTTIRRDVPPREQEKVVASAIELMTTALTQLVQATQEGRTPGAREKRAFDRANEILYTGLGYRPEDVQRNYERIRDHHLQHPELAKGPAAEFIAATETAAQEVEADLAALRAARAETEAGDDDKSGQMD